MSGEQQEEYFSIEYQFAAMHQNIVSQEDRRYFGDCFLTYFFPGDARLKLVKWQRPALFERENLTVENERAGLVCKRPT